MGSFVATQFTTSCLTLLSGLIAHDVIAHQTIKQTKKAAIKAPLERQQTFALLFFILVWRQQHANLIFWVRKEERDKCSWGWDKPFMLHAEPERNYKDSDMIPIVNVCDLALGWKCCLSKADSYLLPETAPCSVQDTAVSMLMKCWLQWRQSCLSHDWVITSVIPT